ncbi:MAG: ABC transporter substrate-binding protein [Spongiibacteraceae bacterium]
MQPYYKWLIAIASITLITACSEPEEAADVNSIPVMFIGQITDTANATPLPEAAAAIKASVASVNARGGIGGKPLALTICDDKADANEAAKCARKAVRSGTVATLGNVSNFGNVILPILAQAGIASIGHNPISAQDFASPAAFPLQVGSPGTVAGAAKLLADQGIKRIRIATVDSPAGAVGQTFAEAGLKGTDTQIIGLSLVPIGAPDYAIYAQSVLQGSDGVLISMNADQAARFITALRQVDADIPVAVTSAALPPATIKQLGQAAEGIVVSMPFWPIAAGGKAITQFLTDMQQYAPQAKINGFSLQAWLSAQTLMQVLNQGLHNTPQAAIDSATVYQWLSQLEQFDLGGVIAPLTTTTEQAAPFNRLFNNKVLYGKVHNGEIQLLDTNWHVVEL